MASREDRSIPSPKPFAFPEEGRRRVVIEGVSPEIDGGRFPIKRVLGEPVTVQADVFGDGHDSIMALLLYRHESELQWRKYPMRHLGNDRWEGSFTVEELGTWHYTVVGRIDHFTTWKKDLRKRFEAGQDLRVERLIGAQLVEEAAARARNGDGRKLREFAAAIRDAVDDPQARRLADLLHVRCIDKEFHILFSSRCYFSSGQKGMALLTFLPSAVPLPHSALRIPHS